MAEGVTGTWKAELLDLRGTVLATAAGEAGKALILAQPRKGGLYLVRAATPTRAWTHKVSLGIGSRP